MRLDGAQRGALAIMSAAVLAGLLLTGCGSAKVDVEGYGRWSLFQEAGRIDGTDSQTIVVDRHQTVTVQLLSDGALRARVRYGHHETPWKGMARELDAAEFHIK